MDVERASEFVLAEDPVGVAAPTAVPFVGPDQAALEHMLAQITRGPQ